MTKVQLFKAPELITLVNSKKLLLDPEQKTLQTPFLTEKEKKEGVLYHKTFSSVK